MAKLSSLKRRALVTGGTRGIGAAIAARLIADGYDVIVTARGGQAPEGARLHVVDFENSSAVDHFVDDVKKQGIDVLINNAGINKIGPFDEISTDDFELIHRINLSVPFRLCQAVLPHMKLNKWGRIINVSSIFGKISKAERASYSASKFGLDGMSVALAAEVAVDGILVNSVAPGFIDTDLTRKILGADGIVKLTSQVPIRRLGRPEEIAAFVSWLASEENSFMTGQNIAVDGGFTRV